MNDRIQKIAQQTDIWCDQNYSGDDHYDLRWEEKFAELLIKECAKVARDEVQYVADWDRADQVAKAITEHFGV